MEFKLTSTKRRAAAFTLTEMLVAAGLGAIVLLGASTFYVFSLTSFASMSNYSDMNNQSRNASDQISRDVRCALKVGSATTTDLQLNEPDGTNVLYSYDAPSATLTRIKGNEVKVVLKQIQSFSFSLYRRPTNSPPTYEQFRPADPTTAKLVGFQWSSNRQLAKGQADSESIQTGLVALRNE